MPGACPVLSPSRLHISVTLGPRPALGSGRCVITVTDFRCPDAYSMAPLSGYRHLQHITRSHPESMGSVPAPWRPARREASGGRRSEPTSSGPDAPNIQSLRTSRLLVGDRREHRPCHVVSVRRHQAGHALRAGEDVRGLGDAPSAGAGSDREPPLPTRRCMHGASHCRPYETSVGIVSVREPHPRAVGCSEPSR